MDKTARRSFASRSTILVATVVSVLIAAPPWIGRATAVPVVQISARLAHTCALDGAGALFCWGGNFAGQLGDGTTTDRAAPVPVAGMGSGVAWVSAGDTSTCAVRTSGAVSCWGRNDRGQLGDGTMNASATPVAVSGLPSGVARVRVGIAHACAVTTGGGVKCWGANDSGQLGDGTKTSSPVPVDVVGLSSGIADVALGEDYTCALTTSGGVKCWGRNDVAQLGNGSPTDGLSPVDVVGLSTGVVQIGAAINYQEIRALLSTGVVRRWGDRFSVPTDDPLVPPGIAAFDIGLTFIISPAIYLSNSGAVYASPYFQLPPPYVSGPLPVRGLSAGITQVAQGGYHQCALNSAGEVKCWGSNGSGAVGEGVFSTQGRSLSPGCVVGLGDSDADRICDSADNCTSGAVFSSGPNARLVLSHVDADPVVGDDRLAFNGRFALPMGVGFAALDPSSEGVLLRLVNPGGVLADVAIPPGVYGGAGTKGWLLIGAGHTWQYFDSTGPRNQVIDRVQLSDRSRGAPGGDVVVVMSLSGKSFPVGKDDLPLQAILIPGTAAAGVAGRCAQTQFAFDECNLNKPSTTVSCVARH